MCVLTKVKNWANGWLSSELSAQWGPGNLCFARTAALTELPIRHSDQKPDKG